MTLIRSVSGVRGTTGVDMTQVLARRYAAAFGEMTGGTVVVGWDGRRGGDELRRAVVHGLAAAGVRVLDAGIVPTPTVGMAVREHGLDGGVVITASHNPETQNGLKFFSARGVFLVAAEAERLFERVDSADPEAQASQSLESVVSGLSSVGLLEGEAIGDIPTAEPIDGAIRDHLDRVLGCPFVDQDLTSAAAPRVVVDCINAAGSVALPTLLRELGCVVTPMNTDPGAGFTRGAEPVPANLSGLGEAVVREGADIGLACDPDADRLAVVDETGRPIGEEYTLVLAARAVLSRKLGPVVANVSTSRMMDDVASEFSVPMYRSPVGEINVVTKMEEVSAVVGGEGNGGVILPDVHSGRDACTAAALVVTALIDGGRPASELVASMPRYSMLKTKLEPGGVTRDGIVIAMREAFPDGTEDLTDGAKMTWPDRWVHARMSGTEPVVRVIAEAPDDSGAEDLSRRAAAAVVSLVEGGRTCAE